jgi:hypothetical protein
LDHWGIGLEEIDSFQLLISTSTEPGFEFLNQIIGILFSFKCPSGIDDIHVIFLFSHIPCID